MLTEAEYQKIIREGRAVEALREYVQRPPGRPKKDKILTNAERQKRHRDKQRLAAGLTDSQ